MIIKRNGREIDESSGYFRYSCGVFSSNYECLDINFADYFERTIKLRNCCLLHGGRRFNVICNNGNSIELKDFGLVNCDDFNYIKTGIGSIIKCGIDNRVTVGDNSVIHCLNLNEISVGDNCKIHARSKIKNCKIISSGCNFLFLEGFREPLTMAEGTYHIINDELLTEGDFLMKGIIE